MNTLKTLTDKIIWPWRPQSNREAGDAVVKSFLLHWFPHRVTLRGLSWGYSLWLGTISLILFIILCVTGVALMFFYVPSVERAYWTIKDIEFVISFGAFLRSLHRIAAGHHGSIFSLENEFDEFKWVQERYFAALAAESKLKKKQIKKILDQKVNVYFDAEQAVNQDGGFRMPSHPPPRVGRFANRSLFLGPLAETQW